jgi:NAD-dependent deacetylase
MVQDYNTLGGLKVMTQTEKAIEMIHKSSRIAALSGAGISTEAGIPDFRGPEGIWNDRDLLNRMSARGFKRDPEGFYQGSMKLFSSMVRAKPTIAHQLLVRLEQLGKMEAVITQNVDGLHQAAGSAKVCELHGTYHTGRCTECGVKYKMEGFYSEIEHGNIQAPFCADCQAPIKPDIVLFEDSLPQDAWEESLRAIERCDLMLVFGSSLSVFPAADLPMMALDHGARLVIVNLESTPYDEMALTVRVKLGDFAQAVLASFG